MPTQRALLETISSACTAYGLRGRLLRFGTGSNLEELVLRHALGERPELHSEAGAAGVLMIPIPQAGILRRVEGVLAAEKVPYIEEVVIHVREGYELVPLREGSSYLGFIFARGGDAVVEGSKRLTFQQLRPEWHLLNPKCRVG